MKQFNVRLPDEVFSTLDKAVEGKNEPLPVGSPAWTRSSYVVAAIVSALKADGQEVTP